VSVQRRWIVKRPLWTIAGLCAGGLQICGPGIDGCTCLDIG
jgi:hypothetical protein